MICKRFSSANAFNVVVQLRGESAAGLFDMLNTILPFTMKIKFYHDVKYGNGSSRQYFEKGHNIFSAL